MAITKVVLVTNSLCVFTLQYDLIIIACAKKIDHRQLTGPLNTGRLSCGIFLQIKSFSPSSGYPWSVGEWRRGRRQVCTEWRPERRSAAARYTADLHSGRRRTCSVTSSSRLAFFSTCCTSTIRPTPSSATDDGRRRVFVYVLHKQSPGGAAVLRRHR